MKPPRLHKFVTDDLLVAALCERIATLANHCINQTGQFTIVLAGGTTPGALYRQLRSIVTDWQCWHIYFGDERWLPAGDAERNDTMAATAWLEHVAIPRVQIHSVPVEENVYAAAAAYAVALEKTAGSDLTLLGLGEDGHTASLFPGDSLAANSTDLAVAITNAPKPPAQRISMSPRYLGKSKAVWFIVTGEGKRQALEAWLAGAPLPPQAIKPQAGIDIFTDLDL
jgi:6-phosphogluconolactonase